VPARAPLEDAWQALAGESAGELEVSGAAPSLDTPYALGEIATAAVGAALLAAAELAEARGGPRPSVGIERADAIRAFTSERRLRLASLGGGARSGFAPLSRFAASADGHIRLHANYPHHRAALLRALGAPDDDEAALAAVRTRGAVELESAIVAAGGAAAAVRSAEQWRAHEQGEALAGLVLLDLDRGEARASAPPLRARGPLPCSGIRVLDLTRVIAGPVGTRMLAALGAEVLRIDPPHVPELEPAHLDGAVGKRSAYLDLRADADRELFERLLSGADVLVTGYRPGALDAFGIDACTLAQRHPQLITVTLSAWGHVGPWAGRRGFDSLVQAACGIATACGSERQPGALPFQALDHASGYLIAAAAMRGLTLRAREGRAAHARLALARTAAWVMAHAAADETGGPEPADRSGDANEQDLVSVSSPSGRLLCVAPPGSIDGTRLSWPMGVPAPGGDEPRWQRASM
jgi:crotonobetainyl-CoA:carnitine CoA-transferase CaiB-like acyl-CoA transferase